MSENVVVLGATGNIGREVVTQLVASGHGVVAVARNAGRLQALASRLDARDRLAVLTQPIATEADGELLLRTLRGHKRPVTAVVAAMRGAMESGRLLDRPGPELLRILDEDVVSNFIAARRLLPLLAEVRPDGGRYLFLSGPMAACAWSGYGHRSIGAAALQMLVQVLREEAKELPVTVQQLQIGTPVRSDDNRHACCPEWIAADEVARRVVELLARRDRNIPIVELGASGAARRATPA